MSRTKGKTNPRMMRSNASLETMAWTAWRTARRHWTRWSRWEDMARECAFGSDEKRECEARASRSFESWSEWESMAKHLFRHAGIEWEDPRGKGWS